MKKITKATLKSFIKKNMGKLYIQEVSSFDAMIDGIEWVSRENRIFSPIKTAENEKHTLGVRGLWLVGGSRNSFSHYDDNKFIGIESYNCCGSCIIAIQKN